MPKIAVKEAVSIAKTFLQEVLSEERPINVGLEELEYDSTSGNWLVTIGFSRPWNNAAGIIPSIALSGRDYRVITVSGRDGTALSMKRHRLAETDA